MSRSKSTYEEENKPLCTWVTESQLAHFQAIAAANNVTPAAYLRAMVVDVIAEESGKVPVPRRRLQPSVFALLAVGEGELKPEALSK